MLPSNHQPLKLPQRFPDPPDTLVLLRGDAGIELLRQRSISQK